METIFSKIVKGEIPCYKVAENEKCLAFLDINPLKEGHVLVIPKVEIDYFFDLDDSLLSELMKFSKNVAKKMKSEIICKKIGLTVVGLEVPHAHIHLIPINNVDDMNFSKPKLNLSNDELQKMCTKLSLI